MNSNNLAEYLVSKKGQKLNIEKKSEGGKYFKVNILGVGDDYVHVAFLEHPQRIHSRIPIDNIASVTEVPE